jgi:putative NADH-flavin reductase
MRIAISGASGLIGSKLAETLAEKGNAIFRLVRARTEDSSVRIFWDPSTKEIEAERLEALDAVIHLAGKPLDEERWTPKVKEARTCLCVQEAACEKRNGSIDGKTSYNRDTDPIKPTDCKSEQPRSKESHGGTSHSQESALGTLTR